MLRLRPVMALLGAELRPRRQMATLTSLMVGARPDQRRRVGWGGRAAGVHWGSGRGNGGSGCCSGGKEVRRWHSSEAPCWSCGAPVGCCSMFCGCGALIPVETHCDFFGLMGLPQSFHVDEGALDKAYIGLQKALHPDRYTRSADEEQKTASTVNSATINNAYQVLRSPALRANYLLTLRGENVLSEDHERTVHDPMLLMHIMEYRERIEASEDVAELEGIMASSQQEIDQVIHEFEVAMGELEEMERRIAEAGHHGFPDCADGEHHSDTSSSPNPSDIAELRERHKQRLHEAASIAVRMRYLTKVYDEAMAARTRLESRSSVDFVLATEAKT